MKKTLMILCGLIMGLSAFAQTSVTVKHPHMTRDAQKTIIKQRPLFFPATITCSNSVEESINKVTFIYSDGSMQATEVTLNNYYVNDMYVTKDSVYFCGKQFNPLMGIIGRFEINDFFNITGEAHIDTNIIAGDAKPLLVEELTRLEYYIDYMENKHLLCIGTCEEDGYPCLVDLLLPLNTYKAGYVDSKHEVFTDLKVVSNNYTDMPYLATVGYDLENGRYLNIRLYKAYDIFSSTGPQDWCHVYCMGATPVRKWLEGGALIDNVDNNTFSTISYRPGNGQLPRFDSVYYLASFSNVHIGLFDINSIASNSVYGLVDNYEVALGITYQREMSQFVYNSYKKTFVFLHRYYASPTSSLHNEYCEIIKPSLSTSGSFLAYTNPGTLHYGLSLYRSDNKYILSGHNINDPKTLMYQMHTFGTLSGCAEPLEYNYEQQKTIESYNFKRNFQYGLRECESKEPVGEMGRLPLYIECEK